MPARERSLEGAASSIARGVMSEQADGRVKPGENNDERALARQLDLLTKRATSPLVLVNPAGDPVQTEFENWGRRSRLWHLQNLYKVAEGLSLLAACLPPRPELHGLPGRPGCSEPKSEDVAEAIKKGMSAVSSAIKGFGQECFMRHLRGFDGEVESCFA
jgi:hypothetical protein